MSKREAPHPSTKASGRPSKSQLRSNSMRGFVLVYRGWRGHRGLRGGGLGCRLLRRLVLVLACGAAVLPPAGHHAQHARHHASVNAASTTNTSGARHWVPKKKWTVASCWLFSAKANRVKKMAALSSHMRYFIHLLSDGEILTTDGWHAGIACTVSASLGVTWGLGPVPRCACPQPRAGLCPA